MKYRSILSKVIQLLVFLMMIVFGVSNALATSNLEMSTGQVPTPTLNPGGSGIDADKLVQEGDQLYAEYDFINALKSYDRALAIYKGIGDRAGTVYVLIKIGNVYLEIGEYQKALNYYQESWPEGEARTLGPAGITYLQLGDLQKAFQFSQEALALKRSAGDRYGEASYLNNVGIIYLRIGEYDEAFNYFQEALLICQEINESALKATILNSIGDTYAQQSDYQKALEYLFQALIIRQELGDPIRIVNTLNAIGTVYESLGDYEQAIDYFMQAISESQKIAYRLGEAQAFNGIGIIFGRLGKPHEALEFFQRNLAAIRELGGNSEGEAALLTNIGFIYYELGDYAKSLENYQNALSIYRATGHRLGEIKILTNIGGIYNDLGNSQKAIAYHQQALINSRKISYGAGEIQILTNIGLIYEEEGDYQKSFEYYSQSITSLELNRNMITVEELRALSASGASGIYEHAVFSLLKLNRPVDAFNYAERAKARTFLDFLGNQQINPKGSENLQLIEQEKQLGTEISAIERQISLIQNNSTLNNTLEEIGNLNSALESKRKEYLNILFQLQLSNPEYASLVGMSPLILEEVQQMLREQAPDTTLVAYFVGDQETAIFVISSNSFDVESVSIDRNDLRKLAENLREQMKKDPILPDAWQTSASTLYDSLIRPVQNHLPRTMAIAPSRLGIIPDDLLHYIPFGLLSNGKIALLDNYSIFYAPSVSSLKFIFEKRHPRADKLLALASPNVPPNPYLYYAIEEAQAAASLYESQTLINADATEGRFKKLAREYGIIHIAAHSDYISAYPMFSAILLAEESGEDGRLETHEIFDLDLYQTDLVVLSACETHLGELSSGDELIGLERAFIRAGTPSILSTLWSVDDAATARLMRLFYTHLKAGVSKGDALRLAQMETRDEYPEPYYWAGFVLVGDHGESNGDLRQIKEQWLLAGWIVAGTVIIVIGIIILYRRQRFSKFI